MKIIKSKKFGGATPRDIAQRMTAPPSKPVVPVVQPPVQQTNQQLPGSDIIENDAPINDQMVKTLLTKHRNGLNKLISGVKTLPDNEVEILIAGLNESLQLIVKSIRQNRRATQITNSQMRQQVQQMSQNAPRQR
jgi:acylphosphatase